jgi:hypothetical protein
MKVALPLAVLALVFASCQKDLSKKESLAAATVSSDVLLPLPCHSTSFVTDYPVKPGEQPPFSFTKTLYPDTRVNTLKMLSRAVPNYAGYKKLMWETNGKFNYATNMATFTGTKELWEYYKTPAGAAARRSVQKKNISLTFKFNEKGYVETVDNNYASWDKYSQVYRAGNALDIAYGTEVPSANKPADALVYLYISPFSDEGLSPYKVYSPSSDQYGNTLYLYSSLQPTSSSVLYIYDYAIPRNGKNYSFIPSQNLISYEYNLCEVMQWLPPSTHQRKTVVGKFVLSTGFQIIQSQYYNNYKFDSKGNETSVTYGDNVPQRTTWYCN